VSGARAAAAGVADGAPVTVATDAGEITLPAVVTEMADHVVWLPTASAGSQVRDALRALPGDLVRVAPAVAGGTDEEVSA
jgi:NADH-quinone oxidoreductase subunit G